MIVYWGGGPRPQATGFKYFVVTHVGAALILISILWILSVTGESGIYTLQSVLAALPRSTLTVLASLFTIGFAVKMAIFPAHVWLPDAHSEAPLPVSVMLSAIMMNMGIYGMIRFLFTLFPPEVSSSLLLPLLIFAVISQWYGGLQALRSTEMKRVAAYSTISQMGYVLIGIASMSALGLKGSIFHMLNHGTAKALLFMSIGAVIHSTGATHLDKVGGWPGGCPGRPFAAAWPPWPWPEPRRWGPSRANGSSLPAAFPPLTRRWPSLPSAPLC